ncbi:pilus assembly FimT family protein [Geothrix oryzisoli]|uniref:pilus assembly FimT family protein n=1 Tax=Geothrix oryzisoli TaxID=2922721 RepID=UPI001FADCCF9|nr:prepilin-type N-terminal cleavage/methylation domain-containing protein [Geothrix oryzisoli]
MEPMPHDGSPNQGYSLIELLVVLAILSILAIVGTLSLGSRAPRAVKSTTLQVRGALQEARELAISTGRNITIRATWDSAAKTASIVTVDDSPVPAMKSQVALDASSLRYCRVTGSGGASLPTTSPDVKSLTAATTYGFSSGSNGWKTDLFNSSTYTFAPNGYLIDNTSGAALLGGFFVGVVGNTVNHTGVPVGVVLVNDQGKIIAFYKADSAAGTDPDYQWQRLE